MATDQPERQGLDRELHAAIQDGKWVVRGTGDPSADDAARGERWGPERTAPADLIFRCLTGTGLPAGVARRALRLEGVRVTGQLDLEAAELRCPVEFRSCWFDEPVILREATCRSIRFQGSHVPGIVGDELTCGGDLDLSLGFTAHGEVRLIGAHVGGQFACAGGAFNNAGGIAVNADSLTVDQCMFCSHGFTADGEVRLRGANISGQLVCAGGTFNNPPYIALAGDGLTVGKGLFCSDGFAAHGEVLLIGAHIGLQFDCTGGTFNNPTGIALRGDSLTIDQAMICRKGFIARGEVRLIGAHIGGQLSCKGATFDNPGGNALHLNRASIDGALLLVECSMNGRLHLRGARCSAYQDDEASWPDSLDATGFAFDDIRGNLVTLDDRLRWIKLQWDGFSPLPYEQLAATYRLHGNDASAHAVAIAKQRHRRKTLSGWQLGGSLLLDATVGYGYRPWLAGLWLVATVAGGSILTDLLDRSYIERAHDTAPGFNSLVYALDQALPIVDLGQTRAYLPHGPAVALTLWMVLVGWALTSVFVLALTGVIKRD